MATKKTADQSTASIAAVTVATATGNGSQLPGGAEATSAAGAADTASATAAVDSGAAAAGNDAAGAVGQAAGSAELTPPPAPPAPDAPPPPAPPPAAASDDVLLRLDELEAAMRAKDTAAQRDGQPPREIYRVVSPLDHDQVRYEIGRYLPLTAEQAAPLLGHTVVPDDD